MMKDLKNKVAVVTGATSGIGWDTALRLADEGVNLVLAGRRLEKGEELVHLVEKKGVKCSFKQTDITNEEGVEQLFTAIEKKFGQLDFAFNNAGIESEAASAEAFNKSDYQRVMDTNVMGTLLSLKYEIPLMKKAGGGSIVNTGSIAGLIGLANYSVYVASKHALLGLTKAVALEVARDKIRVNAVSPAAVQTEMLDRFVGHNDEMKAGFANMHPMGRVGQTEEIASAVAYLFSSESSFMTGQSLTVDGGYTAA